MEGIEKVEDYPGVSPFVIKFRVTLFFNFNKEDRTRYGLIRIFLSFYKKKGGGKKLSVEKRLVNKQIIN